MKEVKHIGIIICDRYRRCAGGKCFRSMKNREGAFDIYKDVELELVGYTSCDGCPGGNVEYAVDEMMKNNVDVVHLATGLIVGYPPCPRITQFKNYIETKYDIPVIIGTHPIPEKYYLTHEKLGTWQSNQWQEIISATLSDQKTRLAYD